MNKRKLIVSISLILVLGFLATNLIYYFISVSTIRHEIVSSSLPLTSDNVYSEFQRELVQPIFISSLMANDTFLRDWVINGEKDQQQITRYLKEIVQKYGVFTSFFVSEQSRFYYHADGILKTVEPDAWRDEWYFRVRELDKDYEINVDIDMANKDAMTIFINHRVFDYDGNFIGAIGVGLNVESLVSLINEYGTKYKRNIMFVDKVGTCMVGNSVSQPNADALYDMVAIADIASDILKADQARLRYSHKGQTVHVNSRYLPELEWILIVEQTEQASTRLISNTLAVNLLVCAILAVIVILLVILTVNNYQRKGEELQAKILQQHHQLLVKNNQLQTALSQVKTLSGLLPVCSSCKKIRDDDGRWQPMEVYISDHSGADFSHGICPECASEHYGDLFEKIKK